MNKLIYINGLGPNYKGDNIYEFIFSETLEVFGENWESKPANGYPWEKETDEIDFSLVKRLVFQFGESEESVKNKLYERDIVLQFEKELSYEK